jgi:hypothetical protein
MADSHRLRGSTGIAKRRTNVPYSLFTQPVKTQLEKEKYFELLDEFATSGEPFSYPKMTKRWNMDVVGERVASSVLATTRKPRGRPRICTTPPLQASLTPQQHIVPPPVPYPAITMKTSALLKAHTNKTIRDLEDCFTRSTLFAQPHLAQATLDQFRLGPIPPPTTGGPAHVSSMDLTGLPDPAEAGPSSATPGSSSAAAATTSSASLGAAAAATAGPSQLPRGVGRGGKGGKKTCKLCNLLEGVLVQATGHHKSTCKYQLMLAEATEAAKTGTHRSNQAYLNLAALLKAKNLSLESLYKGTFGDTGTS